MTKTKMMRAAALFAVSVVSMASHAGLTTLSGPNWPPLGSTGLENVQFNVVSGGGNLLVATGAHAYKEGATLPNNGIDTFYANAGFSPNPPLTGARWAFDYAINYGGLTVANYVTTFSFDADPSAGVSYRDIVLDGSNCAAFLGGPNVCGLGVIADSQNPVNVYAFLMATFDPTASGVYDFSVSILRAEPGFNPITSSITAAVGIPEPGSLALMGLALGAAGLARRRRT